VIGLDWPVNADPRELYHPRADELVYLTDKLLDEFLNENEFATLDGVKRF
jgi:hypothetical protein